MVSWRIDWEPVSDPRPDGLPAGQFRGQSGSRTNGATQSSGRTPTLPATPSQGPTTTDALAAELRLMATGDTGALERFYDATHRIVYGLAFGVLRERGAAEEVALDVYLQVWRQARDFDGRRGTPLAWLTTLARSRAIDRLRARRPQWNRLDTLEAASLLSASDPEAEAMLGQSRQRVRHALAQLSSEQREAIMTAFFSGMSHREVATVLGAPLGTVKTRIRTGMMKMRELLEIERGSLT
jgi:RNA polymerase sigma-70 factor (ECF subfamily)